MTGWRAKLPDRAVGKTCRDPALPPGPFYNAGALRKELYVNPETAASSSAVPVGDNRP